MKHVGLHYLFIYFLCGSFIYSRWEAQRGNARWIGAYITSGVSNPDTDVSVASPVKEFKVNPTEAMVRSVDSCQELRNAVNQMDLYE